MMMIFYRGWNRILRVTLLSGNPVRTRQWKWYKVIRARKRPRTETFDPKNISIRNKSKLKCSYRVEELSPDRRFWSYADRIFDLALLFKTYVTTFLPRSIKTMLVFLFTRINVTLFVKSSRKQNCTTVVLFKIQIAQFLFDGTNQLALDKTAVPFYLVHNRIFFIIFFCAYVIRLLFMYLLFGCVRRERDPHRR